MWVSVCLCVFFFFIFLRTNYQSAILFEGNFFFFTILLLILQVRTNELYTWHCRYIGSGFGFNCFCRCYIHVVCVCESLSVHIFCRLCEAILFEIQKLLLCALLWPPILFRAWFFFLSWFAVKINADFVSFLFFLQNHNGYITVAVWSLCLFRLSLQLFS